MEKHFQNKVKRIETSVRNAHPDYSILKDLRNSRCLSNGKYEGNEQKTCRSLISPSESDRIKLR